jgi:hypothetical protein
VAVLRAEKEAAVLKAENEVAVLKAEKEAAILRAEKEAAEKEMAILRAEKEAAVAMARFRLEKTILKMKLNNIDSQQISEFTGLSIEEIEKL